MKPIIIPKEYNYIGAFLTMRCNLKCSYCINRFGGLIRNESLTGAQWVEALNRIESRDDLPISLQGGEPTLHPDFYYIVNNIKPELKIDLLTNLQFNVDEFMKKVSPDRIKRSAPYASIRVSFHSKQMKTSSIIDKILRLLRNNYSIGVWILNHPTAESKNSEMKKLCDRHGIDCREKEFLGYYEDELHGIYKYPEALSGEFKMRQCRTSELLISETGDVFRCHSDLYLQENPIGTVKDPRFSCDYIWRSCQKFGQCNPCDIKLKFNRFQIDGHCSVEIKEKE